jgi:hypothetical protein
MRFCSGILLAVSLVVVPAAVAEPNACFPSEISPDVRRLPSVVSPAPASSGIESGGMQERSRRIRDRVC